MGINGFGIPEESDEFLHPAPSNDLDWERTETSYFGFHILEESINCEIYHWFHPVLRVMSGGIMIWQGVHAYAPQAEYFDYRNFLPYPAGDIDDITYPTGVHVRVVKPLSEIQVDFESSDGAVALHLTCRSIMPPARKLDGGHFTQAMRCTGRLRLSHRSYEIDEFHTRDRSWGAPRSEVPRIAQPLTWGNAVFGEDLAMHFVGPDSLDRSESAARWGYVWRDGDLRELVHMRKDTLRDADGLTARGTNIDLQDSAGDTYHLEGTRKALLPVSIWPNMVTQFCLMIYEYEGRRGCGDFQDVHFGETLRTPGVLAQP